MANEQNLMPIELVNSRRTREQHSEDSRRAGKKSAEVRRQRKAMQETMKMILNLDLPECETKELYRNMGVEDEDLNIQTSILIEQTKKAMNGNLDSAKFCRDTAGEYIGAEPEKEEQEHYKVCIPAKDIPPAFINVYRNIINHDYEEYILRGGRASLKSSFVSEVAVELLENYPNMCGIVIRRYTNTLRDSVHSQMKWALDKLNETYYEVLEDYKDTTNPLEIVKKSTGQKIYFRGTDDEGKIKSIKPPKDMYIGFIWFEEYDQIQGPRTVRKIRQSVVRGGDKFWIFKTFNTPPSRNNFANKEFHINKKNSLKHESDYRTAPKEWIGQPFIDEAEFIKETSPRTYENEYLGHETGEGGNVFENLEIRKITNEEIESFDWIYKGIDWGWYPDPFAYNNMYYNAEKRELYIFDEFRANKLKNELAWQALKEKGVTEEDLITADSSEKKSIGDFRDYGSNIRGAIKGPGSVEYSMKWLSSLNKIIIDRERCPNTAQEFEEYEYEKDKDGNVITGYPDENNHHIDAVRYALERVWSRRGE